MVANNGTLARISVFVSRFLSGEVSGNALIVNHHNHCFARTACMGG